MKTITLVTGLSLLLLGSGAAANPSFSYNLPNTGACLESASIRDSSPRALSQCTTALTLEATTAGQTRTATLINRGSMLIAADQHAAALRDFNEALTIDSNQPEALLGKAIVLWQAGDSISATELATRALQYRPERPAVAYLVRGLAEEQLGQLRAAYEDLRTARALDPNWSQPRRELARYRVIRR